MTSVVSITAFWIVLAFGQGSHGQIPVEGSFRKLGVRNVRTTSDTRLHITVPSRADAYYVLYRSSDMRFDGGGEPVAAALGQDGPLTFHPATISRGARYFRVAEVGFETPGDLDGDGTDDLTELESAGSFSPLNSSPPVDLTDGAVMIPDLDTLDELSVSWNFFNDATLGVQNLVKFIVTNPRDQRGSIYFLNTNSHSGHGSFIQATGFVCPRGASCVRAEFAHYPNIQTAPGRIGLYVIRFDPGVSANNTVAAFELAGANLPVAEGNLAVLDRELSRSARRALDEAGISLVTDADIGSNEIIYLGLNEAEAFGRLRVIEPGQRPSLQDIAIYTSIPNDVPHIAGIITEKE